MKVRHGIAMRLVNLPYACDFAVKIYYYDYCDKSAYGIVYDSVN